MHSVNFVKNPKGKWYWRVPREGPDVLPLNRFDTYDEAKIDFMLFRSDLAKEWIEDLAASQADRSASELIIETQRERLHGIRRWLLVLGIALLSQAFYIVALLW